MSDQLSSVSVKDTSSSEDWLKKTSRKCQVITFVLSEPVFTSIEHNSKMTVIIINLNKTDVKFDLWRSFNFWHEF